MVRAVPEPPEGHGGTVARDVLRVRAPGGLLRAKSVPARDLL